MHAQVLNVLNLVFCSDIAQDAVASCPVDCIHWVKKDELAALEWVMQVCTLPLLAGLRICRLLCLMHGRPQPAAK